MVLQGRELLLRSAGLGLVEVGADGAGILIAAVGLGLKKILQLFLIVVHFTLMFVIIDDLD